MNTYGVGTHKQWLYNEYYLWCQALNHSSVYNFKDHPQVRRMLSIGMEFPLDCLHELEMNKQKLLITIDNIGYSQTSGVGHRGDLQRMIHYAQQILKRDPLSIVEIGGGVGEFYAVMRALGYEGNYALLDLPDVKNFQYRYLQRVERLTGLRLEQRMNLEFCVSLYALGEFDDELKEYYIQHVVKHCLHGFIVWNPHSGASPEVNFPCNVKDEEPLLAEGNKQLEW